MLYTYSTSEDEGWTRWLLDHGVTGVHGNPAENEFDYVYLNPISIDTGHVNGTGAPLSSFSAILIPSGVSLGDNSTSRAPGFQGSAYCGHYVCPNYDPHYPGGEFPYVGSTYAGDQLGIDSYGITNLKNYMTNGGTIIIETASSTIIGASQLNIPGITVASTSSIPSYGGDGVYLKVGSFLTTNPVVYGLPSTVAGFWENNLAYTVTTATALATYDATNPLMSGYLIDTGHVLNGKVAVAMSAYGSGRAIVFAFKLENRDKDDATFPLLFNSIYYSTAVPLASLP
jgi:hypothetical protein